MTRSILLAGLLGAALVGTGCTQAMYEGQAQARAANEIGCPYSNVKMTYVGSGGWIADGCGQIVRLACTDRAGSRGPLPLEGFCVLEGAPTAIPTSTDFSAYSAPTPPKGAPDREALGSALRDAVKSATEVCGDLQGPRGAGEATLTLEGNGRVASVVIDAPFHGTPIGDCVASELGKTRVSPFLGQPLVLKKDFLVAGGP
jgi:hypothetical protein